MYANSRIDTTKSATKLEHPQTPLDAPGRPTAPQDAKAADLLSVGEAAQELGLLLSKVDRAMRNGRLPYVRVGAARTRYVARADLEAWAAKRNAGG